MIEVQNITKKFPTVTALDGVSLEVRDGEFFGLLGPNGAGKSTLMNLLVGYLDPDAGRILIGGETVTRNTLSTRRMIGLVPQSLALYDDIPAQENMEIFGSFFHVESRVLKERIKERLEAVQLYDRRKDKVKTFSGGMKRRLNLAASLLHDPPLLLCDEPTVGVDPQSRNAIFDYLVALNKHGKTIVYTTHYMEEAERLCSRIAIIDSGTIIAEGILDQLLEKLTYDESVSITKNASTVGKLDLFKQFGAVIDENDRIELKPDKRFRLSAFFDCIEQNGINPRFIELRKPTLEALFLHLTGRRLRD
ncbi:MAG: ABC transporter ATP-binding protein [Ignavibacteriae bacterium]|nr:ABC transporter ATP-binding protein [Ignavibacteria bacterium]MBI3365819.1 ABC transporter ATP-binding protein [Ignavibacteriota bacterium]